MWHSVTTGESLCVIGYRRNFSKNETTKQKLRSILINKLIVDWSNTDSYAFGHRAHGRERQCFSSASFRNMSFKVPASSSQVVLASAHRQSDIAHKHHTSASHPSTLILLCLCAADARRPNATTNCHSEKKKYTKTCESPKSTKCKWIQHTEKQTKNKKQSK